MPCLTGVCTLCYSDEHHCLSACNLYLWCSADGKNASSYINVTTTLTLGYHNLTIWYFQGKGGAGLVLAGSAGGPITTPQVPCLQGHIGHIVMRIPIDYALSLQLLLQCV